MDAYSLGNKRTHVHSGIEGTVGVLEYHLHFPSKRTNPGGVKFGDVLPIEKDLPGRWSKKPEHRFSKRGLAASALPDKTHCAAFLHFKLHVVNGADVIGNPRENTLPDRKVLFKSPYAYYCFVLIHFSKTSHTGNRPNCENPKCRKDPAAPQNIFLPRTRSGY